MFLAMKFANSLKIGKLAEAQITGWLRARGHTVIPIYEMEINTGKGPQILTPTRELVAPDLLVKTRDDMRFVEAKRKTIFTWHRNTKRWVTGIDLRHYEDYKLVADHFKWDVWLLFLHVSNIPDERDLKSNCPNECPVGLFGGEIKKLALKENHRSDRWGTSGMVYWAEESLTKLCCDVELQEVSKYG